MSSQASGENQAAGITFVLVYGSLRTGGIETLIVRMANWLVRQRYPVVVCCSEGALLECLPGDAEVVTYDNSRELGRKLASSTTVIKASEAIVISFDPISAARALVVERHFPASSRVTHLSGIFHTRAYFMTGERLDRIMLNHWVAKAVGYPFLFFMNQECLDGHAGQWRVDLQRSAIVPVPVDLAEPVWSASEHSPLRIVSVGRLVDFKAYNLAAAGLVSGLRQRGIDIRWDIYGDGPLRDEIAAEISKHGLQESVRLKGELEYRQFAVVVAGYDLFFGVGTAALEAAMIGLPVICATDSQRELCYGYLHDLPYGNLGELQVQPPTIPINGLIEAYARAGATVRAQHARLCRAAAMRYGMDACIDQLLGLHRARLAKPAPLIKAAVAWLYHAATESAAADLCRRVLRRKSNGSAR